MTLRAILTMLLFFCFSSTGFASEQVFFYHTDPAGTPLSMTDSNGSVVWKADYKPFGEEHAVTGSAANDKRFVGKEKDEETGLSYFGARYEDAKIGRFTAVDPVRAVDPMTGKTNERLLLNPQRLNVYTYGLNNPYRYIDPNGNEAISLFLAGMANLFLPSVANAPEFKSTSTIHSQSIAEFAGGVALLETGGFVTGRLTESILGRLGANESKSFFEGTKYTNKVLKQMKQGDFHAFPESVKAFRVRWCCIYNSGWRWINKTNA